jgi:hypothetical protein
VVLVLVAATTACIPAPTPPSGYLRPVVDSISSPEPVLPGQDVTIVVQAHDDKLIAGLALRTLRVGDGRTYPTAIPCSFTMDRSDDQTTATFTVTCQVPTFANNGVWDLAVNIRDDYPTGRDVHLPFQVVGGADDTSAPRFVSFTTDPAVITTATAQFTIATRYTDQAGVMPYDPSLVKIAKVGAPLGSDPTIICSFLEAQIVAPATTDLLWRCAVQTGRVQRGVQEGRFHVKDGLGHQVTSLITGIVVVTAT